MGAQQMISGQGQWDVEIMDSQHNVSIWLGTFDTAEDAARAYEEATRMLRRSCAKTNFQLPGGGRRASFSEHSEPFSFEGCGIEEPDSLLGALKAKLSDGKNSNFVSRPKQQNKKQQQQNINLLQLQHNFFDVSLPLSLSHASSKTSMVGNLPTSNCSRGVKRNIDGNHAFTSNRRFKIPCMIHDKEYHDNCVHDNFHHQDQIGVISSVDFPQTRIRRHNHSHTGISRDIKCQEEVPDFQTWDNLHIINQNHIKVPGNRNTLPTTNLNATPVATSTTIPNQTMDLLYSGNFAAEIKSNSDLGRGAVGMTGISINAGVEFSQICLYS